MKANNGAGNVPERDEWITDQLFWQNLNKQYNFSYDCCASPDNTKTVLFSSDFRGVINKIERVAWMNPPFSKAHSMFEHFFKVINRGVAIYRCDNLETKTWQNIILPNCDWVWIPKGRISYTPYDINIRGGNGTPFPSALIGIGVLPPNLPGTVITVVRHNGD